MQMSVELFTVHKRFPLTISRGTTAETTNVWVRVQQDGIEGWGEASPFSINLSQKRALFTTTQPTEETFARGLLSDQRQSTEILHDALQQVVPMLETFSPWERQRISLVLKKAQVPSSAQAAVDVALHDWLGKRVGLPLWRLWGLDCSRIVPTSLTIGINSPEGARARVRDWLQFADVRVLKVKLGSPAGIKADQAMLMAVREEAPEQELFVDANGGWSLEEAIAMSSWLPSMGVKYVEQPLPVGEEDKLVELKKQSPLPIFVDESCHTSRDIPLLADRVHGINIKLMKAGGLTEAMRMVHTARAYGLQIMFGCYSDSSLSNTAAVQLSPLADYLDLDSHLNLTDDPFSGALLQEGRVLPNDQPGLGVNRAVGE